MTSAGDTYTCPKCATGPQQADRRGVRDCRNCDWTWTPGGVEEAESDTQRNLGDY